MTVLPVALWAGLGMAVLRVGVLFVLRRSSGEDADDVLVGLGAELPAVLAMSFAAGLACTGLFVLVGSGRAGRGPGVLLGLASALGLLAFLAGSGSADPAARVGLDTERGQLVSGALAAGSLAAVWALARLVSRRLQRPSRPRLASWASPVLLAVLLALGWSEVFPTFEDRMRRRAAGADSRPPSVILISIDTLRRDHLGLYGYGRDTSPNLDRFASECVVFDRAYAPAPWTLISHMTMLTGLFPGQHGVVEDGTQLSPAIPTLAERLSDRGYHTAAVYWSGWIHERFGYARGFDRFRDYRRGDWESLLEPTYREVLEELPSEDPFFLFLHLIDVHSDKLGGPGATIYDPPAPFDSMFVPDARERLKDVDTVDVFRNGAATTPEEHEAIVALYDGEIRNVDTYLGEWIEEWRRLGLLDESVVIITSDHGEALGQRPGVGGHGRVYEEALRIPLLVRYPDGRGAGRRRGEFVGLVDLVPTVIELLDEPSEDWLPGYSLLDEVPTDRVMFAERPPAMAIHRYPWKISWHEGRKKVRYEVVHLGDDPGELEPRYVGGEGEDFERLQRDVLGPADQLRRSWPELPDQAIPGELGSAEELRALREMGYFGDG